MLRLLLTAAPYLLKGPSKSSQKFIASRLLALALFVLGGLALLIALFLWIEPRFGADSAWLLTGLILFGLGVVFLSRSGSQAKALRVKASPTGLSLTDTPGTLPKSDPLASILPESLRRDPNINAIMRQVSENPVAASAAALTIGMLISRELFGD